ncbi:MAG: 5-formyltetrahydrofolate cyclo-ligase [Coriobacteriales bacterium]
MNRGTEKDQLRAQLRQIRKGILQPRRADLEKSLQERLLNLPAVKHAKTFGVYHAVGSEASIDGAIRHIRDFDQRPTIAYPLVISKTMMSFVKFAKTDNKTVLDSPTAIITNIPHERLVPADQLDLILIPGIGFDAQGHRLGQGGGYYDRFLPHIRRDCLTIGIAFDEQVLDSIPNDIHDCRVDYIVTPTRLITAR